MRIAFNQILEVDDDVCVQGGSSLYSEKRRGQN